MSRLSSAALAAAATGVFLGCWSIVHHGTFAQGQIVDTGLYEQYGDAIARGRVPYRDFHLEYPPGALATFVLPSLGHEGDRRAYDRWFDRLMALCGSLAIAGAALALRGLGASAVRTAFALGVIAFSPLLVGSVALSRFDLWPAALAVLALAALVWERLAVAAVALGAAVAAKLWPAVIAPVAIAWIWRTRGRGAAVRFTATLVAVDAAIFLPFAILSPAGMRDSLNAQLSRPLQLESLAGAILIAVHKTAGTTLHVFSTMSQNLSGPGTYAAQLLTSAAQLAALAAVVALFLRGPATRERLVTHSVAAVTAFVAFSKVFSPQFVLWLVPLAPLVRRRLAVAAFVAAIALTGVYFPRHYWRLAALGSPQTWELLARDLLVVALFVALLVEPRRERVEQRALLLRAEPS